MIRSLKQERYFGLELSQQEAGFVRMDIVKGYHYLEYIDENTTKYISIFNCDPQLDYIPQWLINYIMTKVCYDEMVSLQNHARTIKTS